MVARHCGTLANVGATVLTAAGNELSPHASNTKPELIISPFGRDARLSASPWFESKERKALQKGSTVMFGHMKAEPILRVRPACSVEEAVVALIKATDETQAVRWIEFPAAVLVFVIVTGDSQSGAIYVLDRKKGTWLWVDFEDEQYGGYSIGEFEALVRDYDFLSLVERPGLLRAGLGWLLRPGEPAETVGANKCSIQGTC